jgi:hypothetical protein
MRASKARTRHRAELRVLQALLRIRPVARHTPEVGAVCGKAARTDLCGGRQVTRVPSANVADWQIVLQKSKVAGPRIFAKTRNGKQSPISIASIALAKSPVSLTRGDEVPFAVLTR